MKRLRKIISYVLLLILFLAIVSHGTAIAESYTIGAYFFPGWASNSGYWNDLKGMPGSRSPSKAWPEREPLLGFNAPDELLKLTEKQIDWAAEYGLSFFAYDWYWNGWTTSLNYAIDNHLKAANKDKLKFCILWANHSSVPANEEQFVRMVQYWIQRYFKDPQYLTIDGKPIVIVFSPQRLRDNAATFGMTTDQLFKTARAMAIQSGLPGIYIVGESSASATWINGYLPANGYDAISGYNYHSGPFIGEVSANTAYATSFDELTAGYKSQWSWILEHSSSPYMLPLSAGWDSRPWGSNTPHDNCSSTLETFKGMLVAGKDMMDRYPEKTRRIGIIYAWNEYGEGGYIAPTKKWLFKYLQAVKDVFGK